MGAGKERAWLSLNLYAIELSGKARKSLKALQSKEQLLVATALELLSENPLPPKALKLRGREGYRIRIGKLRIIYTFSKGKLIIHVIDINHRREIYR